MVEIKQRILTSLSRIADRDTHQIAVDDLETIIKTLSPDDISMILNSLYVAINDTNNNKPAIKKEAIRLLSFLCAINTESAATHLTKIIGHIVKRLKDSDSGVKEACRESIGQLSFLYLKGDDNNSIGSVVSLFVKPLFEAMNEDDKMVQAGSAMCMAKMVEMAANPPVSAFQKLCSRICKYLKNPNFLAKAALLLVVSSLSKVGTISSRGLEPLLQCILDCLQSSDWSTRKAAADTLNTLALHSSNLITGKTASTITVLESFRFDKIKPVRDGITEALQQWKLIAGPSNGYKPPDHGENTKKSAFSSDHEKDFTKAEADVPNTSCISRTVLILKKKAPALSDKDLNHGFFQKLETRVSGEVEVVVPCRFVDSQNEKEVDLNDSDVRSKSEVRFEPDDGQDNLRHHGPSSRRQELSDEDDPSHNGNWLTIQKQLLKLERQQTHLMNMLQDVIGGSRDGMVTLENRVLDLERIVEDMAHDLSVSNNRKGGNYMRGFYEPSSRPLSNFNGFSNYPNTRSSWDYHPYARNTQTPLRRTMGAPSLKGVGGVRFGEGPSARSSWQASKSEASLVTGSSLFSDTKDSSLFSDTKDFSGCYL